MIRPPSSINIAGIRYKVLYVDNPAEVDVFKRKSLWGQCDYWTRTIRIYRSKDTPIEDVWDTLIHETLHALSSALNVTCLDSDDNHEEMLVLSRGLTDTLIRNGWMEIEDACHGDRKE